MQHKAAAVAAAARGHLVNPKGRKTEEGKIGRKQQDGRLDSVIMLNKSELKFSIGRQRLKQRLLAIDNRLAVARGWRRGREKVDGVKGVT